MGERTVEEGHPLDLKGVEERSRSRKPGRCALPTTRGRYITAELGWDDALTYPSELSFLVCKMGMIIVSDPGWV